MTLSSLLAIAGPDPQAKHVTLHADRDDFHVSIPLDAIRAEQGPGRLQGPCGIGYGVEQGGPIRLIIRDPLACHSGELDECANVKYLSRIELTLGRGRDTRPVDDAEHQASHDRQGMKRIGLVPVVSGPGAR